MNKPIITIAAYILMIVITFGHAFNSLDAEGETRQRVMERKVSAAILVSFTWPLYWSVKLFKPREERVNDTI